MKRTTLLAVAALLLIAVGICSADTLVITYRSGKTQTVTLDEPSTTINSWQFVAGSAATAPTAQPQTAAPHEPTKQAPEKADTKAVEKAPEKKSNVRFQWNAPPVRD